MLGQLYPLFLACFFKVGEGLLFFNYFFTREVKVSKSLRTYHQYSNNKAFFYRVRGDKCPPYPMLAQPLGTLVGTYAKMPQKVSKKLTHSDSNPLRTITHLNVIRDPIVAPKYS